MDTQKAIRKYLQNYAETAIHRGHGNHPSWNTLIKDRVYHQAVVIPAFNETADFIRRLQLLTSSHRTLFVVVLNGPTTMSSNEAHHTLQPLRFLQATDSGLPLGNVAGSAASLFYFFAQPQHDFLVIDLVNTALALRPQPGVGYARKFGMDSCLHLYQEKQLINPLVRNTDADVQWPENYLRSISADDTISALLFPFRHTAVQANDLTHCDAADLYDSWLRYYVAGLRWAQSPWAFHSVGSTLVIHLHHYAVQRGFPKRQAGEDFYLLNKLAKSGRIVTLPGPPLLLSNRSSNRTPFGTGKAIHSIKLNSIQSWKFYHPCIFDQLKYWHAQLPSLYVVLKDLPLKEIALPEFPPVYTPMHSALSAMGINALLQHSIKHSHDYAGFQRHLMQGIDASTTRKLVHWLRDHFFPVVEFQDLCEMIHRGDVPFLPPSQAPIKTASDLALYLLAKESL